MNYSLPYGKEKINFNIPDDFQVKIVESKQTSAVKDVYEKTRNTIIHPINSPSLLELVKGKKSVCIVVTDISRKCPDKELLIPVLDILEKEVKREKISILVASGMHKKMNYDEKIEKYGKIICQNFQIIDHDPNDDDSLISLGPTKTGKPVKISKVAFEADLLISLGVVEPHQFAGYSGGYKTVSIGVADDETISRTHSAMMIKKSKIKVGQIEGNSIQDEIIEIGKKSGLNFIINVILGNNNEVLEIESGDPIETHKKLIQKAKSIYEIPITKSYDVVVCGVGFPWDSNLYQTTRAASYLYFAQRPVINHDGYIIIPAPCSEGAGKGIGEQRFFSMLKNNSLDEILNIDKKLKAGEQRAYFIAQVLKNCKIIIVGCKMPEIIKETKMIPAKDMEEAFDIVKTSFRNTEILLVSNSLSTLPIIQ